MPGPLSSSPFALQDPGGFRSVAVLGPNTRVLNTQGLVGTAVDTVIFPGIAAVIGKWIVPNTRVAVGGVPTVGVSSLSIAYALITGLGPPFLAPIGPMIVSTPDTKVHNS